MVGWPDVEPVPKALAGVEVMDVEDIVEDIIEVDMDVILVEVGLLAASKDVVSVMSDVIDGPFTELAPIPSCRARSYSSLESVNMPKAVTKYKLSSGSKREISRLTDSKDKLKNTYVTIRRSNRKDCKQTCKEL